MTIYEGDTAMLAPSYSPADYYQVQDAIKDVMSELKHIAKALTDEQKQEVLAIIGTMGTTTGLLQQFDVDQVTAQYALVQKLRAMVLDPQSNLHERTTTKDISALITAINTTIGLFLRNQERLDHLKEMQNMREATIAALKDLPPESQQRFFRRLEELRHG